MAINRTCTRPCLVHFPMHKHIMICGLIMWFTASIGNTLPIEEETKTSTWVFSQDKTIGLAIGLNGATMASVIPQGSTSYNYSLGMGSGKTTLATGTIIAPGTCVVLGGGAVTVDNTRSHLVKSTTSPSVSVHQDWVCSVPHGYDQQMVTVTVTVTDMFLGGESSVVINTSISVDNPDVAFTTGLRTALILGDGDKKNNNKNDNNYNNNNNSNNDDNDNDNNSNDDNDNNSNNNNIIINNNNNDDNNNDNTLGSNRRNTTTPTSTFENVWLPWDKGCVQNNVNSHGMCYDSAAWQNPFSPQLLNNTAFYRYGANGVGTNDTFSLPIVTLLGAEGEAAISLALSPEDDVLELFLNTSNTGVTFTRELLRLGEGRIVTFTAHVVGHANCWRPGLKFLTEEFAPYFEPWVENAEEFEGLGGYSWNLQPYNTTRGNALGFKTNWDLSGTFMPYDGLFLPYQNEWLNLGPINGGLAQYNVTFSMINDYYLSIQKSGFHSLSYFDIGNWGTRIDTNYNGPNTTCGVRPNGMPAPCPDPNGSNEYLRDYLTPALLHHGWDYYHGKWMVHHSDWVGTTDMDTMVPVFENLLLEQLERHFEKVPAFEGIAIDRLDYSEFYNYDYDDNISWVPRNGTPTFNTHNDLSIWGPARAIKLAYRHTFNRLHELSHQHAIKRKQATTTTTPSSSSSSPSSSSSSSSSVSSSSSSSSSSLSSSSRLETGKRDNDNTTTDKLMLINCNSLCRLDQMRSFDGTFSEGASLNSVAWTGLRNPSILWTYGLSNNVLALDIYFQQHILMDVYPMAPMPKNDHSINPGSEVVEKAYRDYAALFNEMHGARWILSANPVSVSAVSPVTSNTIDTEGPALANIFTTPTSNVHVITVMLGSSTTQVSLSVDTEQTRTSTLVEFSALYPGVGDTPTKLGNATKQASGVWVLTVPLVRGCALVKAMLHT